MLLFPTANMALFILYAIPCTRTSEIWRMYLRSCRVMNCCRMDRVVGTERRPSLCFAAISAMVVRNAMKSGPSLPYVSMHIAGYEQEVLHGCECLVRGVLLSLEAAQCAPLLLPPLLLLRRMRTV